MQKLFSFLLIFFIWFYPDKPSSGHVHFSFENTSRKISVDSISFCSKSSKVSRDYKFSSHQSWQNFPLATYRTVLTRLRTFFFGQSLKQNSFDCDFFSKFIFPQNFLPHTRKAVLTTVLRNFRSISINNKKILKKMERKMVLSTCWMHFWTPCWKILLQFCEKLIDFS